MGGLRDSFDRGGPVIEILSEELCATGNTIKLIAVLTRRNETPLAREHPVTG